ncbi:hypothetical protein C8N25_12257 [Algoriphagus antarcticus]|uniref:Uncharacterized protein n=1 Tax=Algoriphagus antarcticus TaxID=238540 RepID=A0A3E0DHW3_9BACT|nr:hypothetical protein C8N25_12257 [Algoriphagus antarcticus]
MILPKLKSNLAFYVSFKAREMIIFLDDGREASTPLERCSSLREASTEDLITGD